MINQTKTAVIVGIIAIVGIGILIFLNKDKFKTTKTPVEA